MQYRQRRKRIVSFPDSGDSEPLRNSWVGWCIWATVFNSHTVPCPSEQIRSSLCFWFLQDLFCFMKWGNACLSVLWYTVIVALAECLGSLPGSKAALQTTYATYLQSMIQSNLPAPLWTLYQRSWLVPWRRSDAFLSLTQSSSLKESTARGRKRIQHQCLNLVIRKKESRGQSSCIVFARVQHFLWRCLWLNKALFLCFYFKRQKIRSWVPPRPI